MESPCSFIKIGVLFCVYQGLDIGLSIPLLSFPASWRPRLPLFLWDSGIHLVTIAFSSLSPSHSVGHGGHRSSRDGLHTDGCLLMTSQVFEFSGGAIEWAQYRNNVEDYLSLEEASGSSLNSHRSQRTLGTLRIKGSGLWAPHWHFNANEHGYLVQV